MVSSSANPTAQPAQTKYARLRGFVNKNCAVFSANSWIAPMAPSPKATAMRINRRWLKKQRCRSPPLDGCPNTPTAATGITIAAIIKKTMKKDRVSRQHFQSTLLLLSDKL